MRCAVLVLSIYKLIFMKMKALQHLMIIKKQIRHQFQVKLTAVLYVDQGLTVTRVRQRHLLIQLARLLV